MPIEQTATVVQASADLAASATSDTVGSFLDALISAGQSLNPTQETIAAIIIAVLVVIRMIWKKYKSVKGKKS